MRNEKNQQVEKDHFVSSVELREQLQSMGWKEIVLLENTDSTNTDAKQLVKDRKKLPLVVIAEHQRQGRGRYQRSFHSPKGSGIYLSMAISLNTTVLDTQYVTIAAALAVCDMITIHYDLQPEIKWLNDIYVHKKKVCGILCEGLFGGNQTNNQDMIVGIGININTLEDDIPLELKDRMTSLAIESQVVADNNKLILTLLNRMQHYMQRIEANDYSFIAQYRDYNFLIGKSVTVDQSNETYLVMGINERGYIMMQDNKGTTVVKHSGEVSLKEVEK